jgi:hypothetical protein
VLFGYESERGEPISFVTVDQTHSAFAALDETGRALAIDSTNAFISTGEGLIAGQNLIQVNWQSNGLTFQLSVIGDTTIESLQDEAIKIAESMIP